MWVQRRLVLGVVGVASLLAVYILCVNLEAPLSWSMLPLKHKHLAGVSGVPESVSDRGSHTPPAPPAPPAPPSPSAPPAPPSPSAPPAPPAPTPHPDQPVRSEAPHAPVSTVRPQQRPLQTTGPTDPPFIGDAYMSEDVPQTDCPDGIRSRVTKTEFGEKFLKNIPVLQWAEDLTPDQHLRLKQYPGAHGWGGVAYQTLEATLSVLNSSVNRRLLDDRSAPCARCAVVGNGGILKDSGKGEEIDGHHYVFRTNGAVTRGFEADVGSRTTHYTFSTNTLLNSIRSYGAAGFTGPPRSQETRYVFLPDHDRDYLLVKAAAAHSRVERGPERGRDPSELFGDDVSAAKLKMYNPDFIRYLRNRFLRSNTLKTKYKDVYRPSTGAVMLLAALHTCDQVSAYGFMTPDYRSFSDHYFDRSFHPVGFFINHDLKMEMRLWQQLQGAGLLQLYTGNATHDVSVMLA